MSSYENIFKKYSINWQVPKKRRKSPRSVQAYSLPTKVLDPSTPRQCINSSCYINTNTKGKYCTPTRYKTLEIIGAEKLCKRKSISNSFRCNETFNICDRESSSKENCNEEVALCSGHEASKGMEVTLTNVKSCFPLGMALNINGTNTGDCSKANVTITPNCSILFTEKNLSDSLKIKSNNQFFSSKQINPTTCNRRKNVYASFEMAQFEVEPMKASNDFLDKSLQCLGNKLSQPDTKTTHELDTVSVENSSTELDLLIDLIQQEEEKNKRLLEYKKNGKFINDNASLPRIKSSLKGGYQELFEKALKHEKVKSNFLKYDKKIGLRTGQLLTIVKIETAYGLTLATVESKEFNRNFAIIIKPDMAQRLTLGSQIEAFFDNKTFPYKLQLNGENIDVYLEPYKLLLV